MSASTAVVATKSWSHYLMFPLTVGLGLAYTITNINMRQFAELLRDLLITTCNVDDPGNVSKLDNLVLKEGYSSAITLHQRTPGDGFHLYIHWVILCRFLRFPFATILYRYMTNESPVYSIYALTKRQISHLRVLTQSKNTNCMTIHRIVNTSMFRYKVTPVIVKVPEKMYSYQEKLVNEIFEAQTGEKSQTILICGTTGVGKSIVARFLHQKFGNRSILVEGFDPTNSGLNLTEYVFNLRANTDIIIILLLNEIDIAMAFSRKPQRSDYVSHAQSKTSLCEFFDALKDTPNIITICTSNSSVNEFSQTYKEYVRDGRFDIRRDLVKSEKTASI